MGYGIKEASKLAEGSAIFSNISEGMDIQATTETMISAIKAYGISAQDVVSGVVDKINQLGNSYAITNKDLSDILKRSASAGEVANNSIDQLLALGTAANEIVQDSEGVGTAIKTISLRLMQLDEDTETVTEDSKKLGDTLKALTGVSIFESDGTTLKSTFTILQQISQVFDSLSDSAQADVLEMIGGKRQANIASAILTNFATAEKALATSIDSVGSSAREQATFMDSINAKINTFKESVTGLWQNLISQDAIKGAVSTGNILVNILDALINKTGAILPILLTSISLYTIINALKKTTIFQTALETAATVKKTVATMAENAAMVAQAIAGKNLKDIWAALQLTMAANPLGWITLGVTAIYGIIKGVQWLTTSYKEQVEIVENLKSKVSELKTEQDSVISKIDELDKLGAGNLNKEQQEYLQSLKETNDQLDLEIKYQQKLLEIENQDLTKRAVKRLQKKSEASISFTDTGDVVTTPVTPTEKLKENIEAIKDYDAQIRDLTASQKNGTSGLTDDQYIAQLDDIKLGKQNIVAETERLITSVQEEANNIYDTSGAFNELKTSAENAVTEAKKAVAGIDAQADAVKAAEQKIADAKAKLDIIWASKGFETAKNEIKSLIETENLNKDTVMDLAKRYPVLYGYLRQTGVSIEQLIPQFVSLNTGISDSNSELSELIKSFSDVVKEVDSFNNALKEQEENGSVSIDTFLSMVSSNEKLISVFKFEHGQIKINKEAYQQLAIAKIQEMQATKLAERQTIIDKIKDEYKAVTDLVRAYNNAFINQMFVQQIQDSINDKITNATKSVNVIIDAMQKVMNSIKDGNFDLTPSDTGTEKTWIEQQQEDFKKQTDIIEHQIFLLEKQNGTEQERIKIYEQLQKKLKEQADLYRANGFSDQSEEVMDLQKQWWKYSDAIDEVNKSLDENIKKTAEAIKESAKNSFEALEDTVSTLKEIDKLQKVDELDALDDLAERYDDIVDSQLKSLELEKKKSDYQDDVAEKVKVIAKKEAQLNIAKLDTSREGQAKQIQLADELHELQKDLTDTQKDYQYDVTKEALEDERDEYKKNIDKKKKDIQSFLNDETAMYDAATNLMAQDSTSLQNMLRNYYIEQGKLIDNEVINKWKLAKEAASEYGSVTAALTGLSNTASSESNEDLIGSLVGNMKSNSSAWNTASDAKKIELSNSNKSIASQIASITGKTVTRTPNGVWMIGSEELYNKKFHTGGAIGGESLLQKEVPFIGEIGEHVLTKGQQKAFLDMMATGGFLSPIVNQSLLKGISNGVGNISNNNSNSNVQGAFSPTVNVQITATDLNDRELDKVANTVVNKINGVFNQYGITNSRLGRVR